MVVKITIQASTFAATGTFTPNQIITIAADLMLTLVDPMFVVVETSKVDPVAAPLVVEAIVTDTVLNFAAMASCAVVHLVIIAVVPSCIGLLHMFAATTTS